MSKLMMVDEGVLANNALEARAAEQAYYNNLLEANAAENVRNIRLEVLSIVASTGVMVEEADVEDLLDAAEAALKWVLRGERTVKRCDELEPGAWDDGK